MVMVDKKPPMYLSETKLGKLFRTDMVDEHFRKAFLFYAMTGYRFGGHKLLCNIEYETPLAQIASSRGLSSFM